MRPQIFATDRDSQTSALLISLFFSHGRSWGVSITRAIFIIVQDFTDFGGEDASCLSQEHFKKLLDGDDEASLDLERFACSVGESFVLALLRPYLLPRYMVFIT